MTRVYKILPRADLERARITGAFPVSEVDARDGFVHLSTAAQAGDTARKWFAGRADLVALQFQAEALEAAAGVALRWEPSRDGDLFPHLYAPLPLAAVEAVYDLPLAADGAPALPDLPA